MSSKIESALKRIEILSAEALSFPADNDTETLVEICTLAENAMDENESIYTSEEIRLALLKWFSVFTEMGIKDVETFLEALRVVKNE